MAGKGSEGHTVLGMDRRSFCVGTVGTVALLGLGGAVRMAQVDSLVRPPGGQDEDHLNSCCIRCGQCMGACARRIIAPAHIESGVLTVRTPMLNFDDDYCDWCAQDNGGVPQCVEVCPTGALALPEGSTAQNTVIGIAEVDRQQCLAWRMMLCKFCSAHCPFDAIRLDDFNRPIVIEENCTGCGACEAVCVSMQNGSIAEGAAERAIKVRSLGGRLSENLPR